jgi:hypothetical protein
MSDTSLHSSALLGDADFSRRFSKPGKGQLARLDTYWAQSSVAIVSARGDIDKTNAPSPSIHSPT